MTPTKTIEAKVEIRDPSGHITSDIRQLPAAPELEDFASVIKVYPGGVRVEITPKR